MSSIVHKLTKDDSPKAVLARATVWNLVASLINASMTAVIMLVMSWSNMTEDVGIFSIATAIAYQVQAIGFFGVRNLHIADVKKEYSFSDYVWSNLVSSVFMFIVMIFMIFPKGYPLEKSAAILFYTLYRALDIYEAWFHDEYQRQGRLDIGLVMQTIRFVVSLIIMSLVMIVTKSFLIACIAAFASSAFMIWMQNRHYIHAFSCHLEKINKKRLWEILKISFPICVSAYVSMYLVNAGKFAIDNTLDNSFQTIFAVLLVPVFTINLLSTVIYRPFISIIAEHWSSENYREFTRKTLSMCAVILVLTLGITLFGYVLGLWMLGLIYHMDLMEHSAAFVILLLGGGLNTYAQFLAQILVIIRQQNKSMILSLISFAATLLLGNWMVANWTILGAALLYGMSSLILCLGSAWVIIKYTRQSMRKKGAGNEEKNTGTV
mgnify:CR=1 FL=1